MVARRRRTAAYGPGPGTCLSPGSKDTRESEAGRVETLRVAKGRHLPPRTEQVSSTTPGVRDRAASSTAPASVR